MISGGVNSDKKVKTKSDNETKMEDDQDDEEEVGQIKSEFS